MAVGVEVGGSAPGPSPRCPICQKQAGHGPLVGPVVHQDELVHVAHRADGALGYLFVETRRHVAQLDELTDAEAAAVGRVTTHLARALRAELDVEHVHTFVAGLAVPHFHQHVFVRHPGTPDAHPWWQPWPGAPRGDAAELTSRLRRHLSSTSHP